MKLAICPECGKDVKARGLGTHRRCAHGISKAKTKSAASNGKSTEARALPARRDEIRPVRRGRPARITRASDGATELRVSELSERIERILEDLQTTQRVICELSSRIVDRQE